MSEKKIIAVMGATGSQGGGLVRAISSDSGGPFAARALTRNKNSDKAKEVAELGAEVVEVDVDDAESVKSAFDGAYGAFCVTFFWEHLSPEKEKAHAKNMADAAKSVGLEHVIWSSLEDTREWVPLDDDRMPTLMDHYKVPHFDAKGECDKLFLNSGVPATVLRTCGYWDNLIHFGWGPKPGPDGKLAITFPMGDKRLPGIAAEDIGKCAYGIFKAGSEYFGKTVGIAGEFPTGDEMATALSKALGKEVVYQDVPPEVYRSFDFPGAEDLGNMFQFKRDFEEVYCGNRNIDEARSLNPSLMTFEDWLKENASHIPLE